MFLARKALLYCKSDQITCFSSSLLGMRKHLLVIVVAILLVTVIAGIAIVTKILLSKGQ